MAKFALTDSKVKAAKPKDKDYKLFDGLGLYLLITKAGGKLWRLKYRLAGKEYLLAIGKYPAIGVAAAHDEADKARTLIEQGTHPLAQKKAAEQTKASKEQNTFGAITRDWIDASKGGWSPSYLKQVKSLMGRYIFDDKNINDKPIREVTAKHIREICLSVAKRDKLKDGERKSGSVAIAILVRQYCGAVFRYAIGHDKADTDPTFALRNLPELKRAEVKHNRALSPNEIKNLLTALGEFGGARTTSIAIELLLLMFVRTCELRQATWDEFDLSAGIWRIPAKRMKMGKEHTVPLSVQAIRLLKELRNITGYTSWLFPNYRRPDDCMSPTTINRALERMAFNGKDTIGFAAHGFRGTASTLLHEMNFRTDVIELQLAHVEGNKVKASYNHAKYMSERKVMMQHWADYLDGLKAGAKVIAINSKAV